MDVTVGELRRRLRTAADVHKVNPEYIQELRARLQSVPFLGRAGYLMGHTHVVLLQMAEAHRECQGCSLCDSIAELLAAAMAFDLVDTNSRFSRIVRDIQVEPDAPELREDQVDPAPEEASTAAPERPRRRWPWRS